MITTAAFHRKCCSARSFKGHFSLFCRPPRHSCPSTIGRGGPLTTTNTTSRSYFTNGQSIKKNDPYAILGLQWGDGATTSEIKDAFRRKARELHPDLNTTDSPQQALLKFQQLQKAYETLTSTTTNGAIEDDSFEEWRLAIWRRGDRIAMDRTDVAGVRKKRPVPPAASSKKIYAQTLGHPQGGVTRRGEYLESAATTTTTTTQRKRTKPSSVGSGQSKWVTPKEFKPYYKSKPSDEESVSKDNNSKNKATAT
eukprot:scaffold12877_cov84-Cylindrotheca_fusiformis.AAC.2